MAQTTREVHLVRRPRGWPTHDDFELREVTLPDPGDGEVLVRNTVMSVDPYMRPKMNEGKSYTEPFELGEALYGGAVGEVLESRVDGVRPGDTVQHGRGWREHAVVAGAEVRTLDVSEVPAEAYLSALGMTSMTAYVGLTRIAELREGDVVLVSGAAGAVGSIAGQMARLLGAAKVVGTAGTDQKCAWLRDDLGFDVAINYKDDGFARRVREHGEFDVYFDNVGSEHLEAAIGAMADFGRIAACGSIAGYNAVEAPPGPRNLAAVVQKRLTLRGFIVSDHPDVAAQFASRTRAWLSSGQLVARETTTVGIESAVDAFLGLCRGDNTGKMLVRLDS